MPLPTGALFFAITAKLVAQPIWSYSMPTMFKAIILVIGVSIYMYFLQYGQEVANRELRHVESLYTDALAPDALQLSSTR